MGLAETYGLSGKCGGELEMGFAVVSLGQGLMASGWNEILGWGQSYGETQGKLGRAVYAHWGP